jgi:hypothetical protein
VVDDEEVALNRTSQANPEKEEPTAGKGSKQRKTQGARPSEERTPAEHTTTKALAHPPPHKNNVV